jgi:hypothetical protein
MAPPTSRHENVISETSQYGAGFTDGRTLAVRGAVRVARDVEKRETPNRPQNWKINRR